jgi:hypothetical protein
MNAPLLHSPDYWRRRAEELLALAPSVADPKVRQAINEIAQNYERLAQLTEAAPTRAAPKDTSVG